MSSGSAAAAERCSRYGAAFTCGAVSGSETCWCMARPPVAPVPGRTCLCPACLDVTDRLHRGASGGAGPVSNA
ncbi:MAG: cysteine-rich CWC family protein [Betaproteobacteria bacterium]|nr:cysteine-rich CWC family protein [Betaproteobacteria bacterium]